MSWEVTTVETIPFREQYDVLDEEEELVCSFIETREKADLIAAAPELLEAAEKAKNQLEWEGLKVEGLEKAINKAKGVDDNS